MRNYLPCCAATLLALSVMTFSAQASSEEFSKLLAEADALAAKGEGLHYDNVVGQFAASTFGPAMRINRVRESIGSDSIDSNTPHEDTDDN